MLDEDTRKTVDAQLAALRSNYLSKPGFIDLYVEDVDMPDGRRTVLTSVVEAAGCKSVGHAVLHRGDRFDVDVGVLLSSGRAFQNVGDEMLRKGLERSRRLDSMREVAKEGAKKLMEIIRSHSTATLHTTLARQGYHDRRLNDALRSYAVLSCTSCHKFFGVSGKATRRVKMVSLPAGVKKPIIRKYLCPHCAMWVHHPKDDEEAWKIVGKAIENKPTLSPQQMAKEVKAGALSDVIFEGVQAENVPSEKDPKE